MDKQRRYPSIRDIEIKDSFWTPYLENCRKIMAPYVLEQIEAGGYLKNFLAVAEKKTAYHGSTEPVLHIGPPFSDGLLLESLRGACDLLAAGYDEELALRIERIAAVVRAASYSTDGFLSTKILTNEPEHRWGENGGHIIYTHDLYNHGALIEAAVSHYQATASTLLLDCAVRAANLICDTIGYPPKSNIVPGHSLPEEAFVRLYHLFKDSRELKDYAVRMKVNADAYLEMADFWYKARGNHDGRPENPGFTHSYNQDNVPFEEAREAVGHAVRASLCYTGAADVSLAYGDGRYTEALRVLWRNVVDKKMHISGGIGTRHDIEGFDVDYNLPNDAYLETCAAIGLTFWAGEMNLLFESGEYFDIFERALYNNVLDGVGEDFRHFFYQNPLISDGGVNRWGWHGCPCCPPMLLKIFSSLGKYIFSCSCDALYMNMYIGSRLSTEGITADFDGKNLKVCFDRPMTVKLRVPEYAENFRLSIDGRPVEYSAENGYAVLHDIEKADIAVSYTEKLRRVYANPMVKDDIGRVAVMDGKYLMCAEGTDNGGDVDFVIAEAPMLTRDGECVVGKRADGSNFRLIPYYKWCRRTTGNPDDDRMAVWFMQENMKDSDILSAEIGGKLYRDYE